MRFDTRTRSRPPAVCQILGSRPVFRAFASTEQARARVAGSRARCGRLDSVACACMLIRCRPGRTSNFFVSEAGLLIFRALVFGACVLPLPLSHFTRSNASVEEFSCWRTSDASHAHFSSCLPRTPPGRGSVAVLGRVCARCPGPGCRLATPVTYIYREQRLGSVLTQAKDLRSPVGYKTTGVKRRQRWRVSCTVVSYHRSCLASFDHYLVPHKAM